VKRPRQYLFGFMEEVIIPIDVNNTPEIITRGRIYHRNNKCAVV